MILTILGLLLLLFPLTLLWLFKDKLYGFVLILSALLAGHLLIGLITQSLGIFYYPVILGVHLFSALIITIILIRKRSVLKFKLALAPFVLVAFALIFFQLASVHNYYSGSVSTMTRTVTTEKASYPYPYFSDEWVGVALVNYSLENNTLASGNPLMPPERYHHFSNLLIAFFSLTAELMLLLQLTPLTAYAFFALISGLLICYLVYILLRANKLSKLAAVIGALAVPLITNSNNLPGLWYYIPFTGGLIAFLLSLSAASLRKFPLYLLSSLLTLIFYPPLGVLVIGVLIAVAFFNQDNKFKQKVLWFLSGGLVILGAALTIIFLQVTGWNNLWSLIKKTIFYSSLDKGLVNFSPENILPIAILGLALLGIFYILKLKKYFILFPLLIGLAFWTVYSYTFNFFIISAERVVVVTAILLTVAAAFGSEYLLQKIPNQVLGIRKDKLYLVIKIGVILIFGLTAFTYTSRDKWLNLKLQTKVNGFEQSLPPSPPATEYLNQEDLEIFAPLQQEKFLAPAWKGLTIGAATGNYPLNSKSSFISNRLLNYSDFMRKDCAGKNVLADKYKVFYFYTQSFDCPLFKKINSSSENLNLYKFTPETAFSE